jgi:hypothetical protein
MPRREDLSAAATAAVRWRQQLRKYGRKPELVEDGCGRPSSSRSPAHHAEGRLGQCRRGRACRARVRVLRPPLLRLTATAGGVAAQAPDHQQTGVLLYHIISISLYYTYYDTIIFHYDTIIMISLIFCKCPDYYFSLFHYPKKDYYFTYDTFIISLILSA